MNFQLQQSDSESKARAGSLHTDSGIIETPIFMPVGTLGNVKGVHFEELKKSIGAQIILGNTYHLYLRPGLEVLQKAGGLKGFGAWKAPLLTDSGGYQVYSLSQMRKITDEGVHFQSHIDGSKHFFTPESVIDIQRSIGADIIMAFDECPPYPCTYEYAHKSLQITHNWLERCFKQMQNTKPLYGYEQTLFPIVQGSVFKDLRSQSVEYCSQFDSIGIAIGGLSVGEPAESMYEITDACTDQLPENRARYLMGVGTPANILECIALGIDMFDCVMPTRNGRNGMLFTRQGIINIKNLKWKEDFSPLDEDSELPLDKECSKAFLRHLTVSGEMLAAQISSLHNLSFYLNLVKEARARILDGTFTKWKNALIPQISQKL